MADTELLHLETEFRGAGLEPHDELVMIGRAILRPVGFVEIDGREHAMKRRTARPAELRHEGAGERIAAVTGFVGGLFDAPRGVGIDAKGAAQGVGDRGARESEDLGKRTQGGSGGRHESDCPEDSATRRASAIAFLAPGGWPFGGKPDGA